MSSSRRKKTPSKIVQGDQDQSIINAEGQLYERTESVPKVRKGEMFRNLKLEKEEELKQKDDRHQNLRFPAAVTSPVTSDDNFVKNRIYQISHEQTTEQHQQQQDQTRTYVNQSTSQFIPTQNMLTQNENTGNKFQEDIVFEDENQTSDKRLNFKNIMFGNFGIPKSDKRVAIAPMKPRQSNKRRRKNRIQQLAQEVEPDIDQDVQNNNVNDGNSSDENSRREVNNQQGEGFTKKQKIIAIASVAFVGIIIMILVFILIPKLSKNNNNSAGTTSSNIPKGQVLANTSDPFYGDPEYRDILFLDPVSKIPTVNFPISKQKYLKALKHPNVKLLPLKFEVNELCNYKASVKFKVESDSLGKSSINGKEQELAYNVSFYTTAIAKDYITVITHYLQDVREDDKPQQEDDTAVVGGGGGASANNTLDSSGQAAEDIYTTDENQTASDKYANVDPDTLNNEDDQLAFITSQTKLSICNISRSGNITACSFNDKMSFSDDSFAIKLLQMYVPNLNIDHYQKKHRLLNSEELDSATSQESTGSFDEKVGVEESQIGLLSQSKDTADDGSLASTAQTNSENGLDLDTGKVANAQKEDKVGFSPSSNSDLKSNETTVKKIDSEAFVTMVFVNRYVLLQADIEKELLKLEAFDFVQVQNPAEFFTNRNMKMKDVSSFDESNGNETRLLFAGGRDLVSSSFDSIDLILGKVNVLFVTLQGGFGFQCSTDDICITGLFIEPQPFPKFWPIRREVRANMGKTIKSYRYLKLVFQQNILLLKNITDQLEGLLDVLIINNLNAIGTQFQRLTQPIFDIEEEFSNYTDKVLSKVSTLAECLDVTGSIAEVLDSYTVLNLQGFIGQMQLQIDQVTAAFEDQIVLFNDEVLQAGKRYSNASLRVLQSRKEEILSIYDSMLDKFDTEWDGFVMSNLQKFDFLNFKFSSIGQGQSLVSIATTDIINSVINIVMTAFTSLVSPLKEIYGNLKQRVRVQTILYHAQTRQSLQTRFDHILANVDIQGGESVFSNQHLSYLQTSHFQEITAVMALDVSIIDIADEESRGSLMDELQSRIARDLTRAVDIVQEILTCADERKFFDQVFTTLEQGVASINSTIFTNISSTISNSIDQFKQRFDVLKRDIQSIPDNIDRAFSDQKAMEQPSGVIDINREIQEVKGLIQTVEDIMDEFSGLVNIQKRINAQITSIKNRSQSVIEAPNRIKVKFELTVSKIKEIGQQLKLSFKIPVYKFKLGPSDFSGIFMIVLNQIQSRALEYGTNNVKYIGQTYGTRFISSLNSKLDLKISQILPRSQRTVVYNQAYKKEITLFQANVPIAFGSLYTQIAQSFTASMTIFYEFSGGKLQIIIDPYSKFAYNLRLAWDLVLVRTGMSLAGTIFEGRIFTAAGFNVLSLTPSAYMQSYVYFSVLFLEFALVYSYLWPRLVWRCWYIGRRRCRIRVCYPMIIFQWTPWRTVQYRRQYLGVAYKKELINKEFKLSLL